MASIESNSKNSFHIRCNSLPSSPHPLVSQCEEHLNRFKSSESASSSSSSISHDLSGLQDLHDSIDKLLQLQITQQAFEREFSRKCVDELLDGSLRLLDIFSTAKDCLLQSKESMLELQSAIRRTRGSETAFTIEGAKYLASRKKVKKAIQKALKNLKGMKNDSNHEDSSSMISMLKEAEAITVSSLESLLLFISNPSKKNKWSVISKLMMQPKRVACDAEKSELNEFEMVDSTLKSSSIDNFQSHMENLEMCLQDLEVEVERISRKLIRTRVSLLNIFNNYHKLSGLQDLHDCVEKLIQLPLTQEALFQENYAEELLEGSLKLLDVCTAAKDSLLHTKECAREVQSIMRRRKRGGEMEVTLEIRKYLTSRKVVKKAIFKALSNLKCASNKHKVHHHQHHHQSAELVRLLKDVEVVSISILESVLKFISGPTDSKSGNWSLVSKMMKNKRVSCSQEEAEENEFAKVDAALQAFVFHTSSKSENVNHHDLQNQLENLDIHPGKVEDDNGKNMKNNILRTSHETSSSSSSSSLSQKLEGLQDLHDCIEKLVQLPLTQEALVVQDHHENNMVDELLNGSLRLLDVCTSAKDALLHTKECTRELQSVIRRRRRGGEVDLTAEAKKFLTSRKVVRKATLKALENMKGVSKKGNFSSTLVSLLNEVEVVTLSIFESLLNFISGSTRAKSSSWFSVSKLMHKRRVASCAQVTEESEFAQVDAAMQCFVLNLTSKKDNSNILQNQLENLDSRIQELEEGFDFLFRRLIKTRVALLNILNH
ncbi:DUF241 domain protein [Senna tora]|uniref:DUF241 domain protein n=1 Tax=Senna tora TaxID=362788 RepID=A0A834W9S5_9FABA|nr:DUF241 domain protein [Senna tora]